MAVDHQALAERIARAVNRNDFSVLDELLTEDYMEEYPQSREVIRGRHNLRAVMENIPDRPAEAVDLSTVQARAAEEHRIVAPMFTVVRVQGRGQAGTMTLRTRYPDGSSWWMVMIYELRGNQICRATTFFAPEFEAPEWRAPYVERV